MEQFVNPPRPEVWEEIVVVFWKFTKRISGRIMERIVFMKILFLCRLCSRARVVRSRNCCSRLTIFADLRFREDCFYNQVLPETRLATVYVHVSDMLTRHSPAVLPHSYTVFSNFFLLSLPELQSAFSMGRSTRCALLGLPPLASGRLDGPVPTGTRRRTSTCWNPSCSQPR